MKLWDWQVKDQETLEANNWNALCAIETGGAKTALGSAAIANSGAETTLIVAPDQTHESAWMPTVKALTGLDARIISNGRKAEKVARADFEWGVPGVYMVTPQLLTRSDIEYWAGDLLIVDEIHLLGAAGKAGQRKLSGYNALKDGEPLNARFDKRISLSGTPLRNKFEYAWSLMRFHWPELYKRGEVAHADYWLWLKDRMTSELVSRGYKWVPCTWEEYKGRAEGVYGKVINRVPHLGVEDKSAIKWLVEAEPGRLFNEAPCVIQHFRRRKCCEFHPEGFLPIDEPQVISRVIDLAPAQKKAIRELEKHYMTYLAGQPLVTELTLTQQQRIRQMCLGVPTIEWIEVPAENEDEEPTERMLLDFDPDCVSPFADELLRTLEDLDEDEPVTVFLESQKFAAVLTHKLNKAGVPAFEYSGQTRKTRTENMAEFGKKFQVAVVVISAGGTGLDGLQKVCKTEVWFERSADLTNNQQAEARTDRLGAVGQVQRIILKDPFGYTEGRMGSQLEKELSLRQSTTVRRAL